jgi:hypothetical protein
MNVNISEKTEIRLRRIAKQRGQSMEDVAREIIEENIEREEPSEGKLSLSDLAGMFNGGDPSTAERAPEILRAELGENSRGRS